MFRYMLQCFRKHLHRVVFSLPPPVRTCFLLRQNRARLTWQMRLQWLPCTFRRLIHNWGSRRNSGRCSPSSLLGSLPVRPAATPTVRSAGPTSPICARTPFAAAWRSAASAVRSPLLARPVARFSEGVVRPWKEFVRAVRRSRLSMLRGLAYRDQEGRRALTHLARSMPSN